MCLLSLCSPHFTDKKIFNFSFKKSYFNHTVHFGGFLKNKLFLSGFFQLFSRFKFLNHHVSKKYVSRLWVCGWCVCYTNFDWSADIIENINLPVYETKSELRQVVYLSSSLSLFLLPASTHALLHPRTLAPSHPRTLTLLHPHTLALTHTPILAPSHPHTITLLHPRTLTPHTLTPSHFRTLTPSHPHTFTPSHPHTLTPSHPHTLAPSHLRILTPSHPRTLTPSHPHALAQARRYTKKMTV